MSRNIGLPERDYVILGEGNTSAKGGENTYWIKASGLQLNQIEPAGFVEVNFAPVLAMLEGGDLDDAEINRRLIAAKTDPSSPLRPSVEAALHAVIYQLCGASFIGHTHPTAVNAILCAENCQSVLTGRLFPDHIVFCGAVPVFVPYIDPGIPLARALKQILLRHLDEHGEPPKTIFLQNHGLIALAKTAGEVESITAMAVKSCRILTGTAAFGGPHFLSEENVARIYTRPDEHYRRKQAGF
jgi:rhamnose utilization protein RhaD (predicted bifunctional aldolase and dehydrogenase)